ncbi:kinase-like domain-containing protein [Rhexocercosporidium sp. MPI-PUGE-AT-0058]|nr:kinase-like domain-containing protein [Rhexocercosporidium sp. MPI-PUGE-AT-0058]
MAGVNHSLQGHMNWSATFYEAFRWWDRINNPPPLPPAPQQLTNAAIQTAYGITQAAAYALPVPAIAVPAPAIPPALPGGVTRPPLIPPLAPDTEPNEEKYLRNARGGPRGLGAVANWTPIRILGSGGGGAVALWEWSGPAAMAPAQTKIAVKNTLAPSKNLNEEGRVMAVVGASLSEHVARLIVPPEILTPAICTARGLSHTWDNVTRQLIIEYCPQGTLDDLLDMRKERNIRFEEMTLWHIFECLVDGCSVLEYGMELTYDPLNRVAAVPAAYVAGPSLTTIVHRDLKPTNIFTGARSASHVSVPAFKIGDFGGAQEWHKIFANTPNLWPSTTYAVNHRKIRRRGTRGYYTPESFHPAWNYNDYRVSPICGKFGSHTNVWQVGAIMYELACFNLGPPEAHLPFTPGHLIHGAAPLGRLYGTQLRNQPGLSNLLKDTIHECLYEIPTNRASLLTLKTRIRTQLNVMTLDPTIRPEGAQDLECPEPITEAQQFLPAFAQVNKQCTALKRWSPGQCTNTVNVWGNNNRPRCGSHWNLRDYPLL